MITIVLLPTQKKFKIDASENESVFSFREKVVSKLIENDYEIEAADVKLIFNGIILEDDKSLDEFKVGGYQINCLLARNVVKQEYIQDMEKVESVVTNDDFKGVINDLMKNDGFVNLVDDLATGKLSYSDLTEDVSYSKLLNDSEILNLVSQNLNQDLITNMVAAGSIHKNDINIGDMLEEGFNYKEYITVYKTQLERLTELGFKNNEKNVKILYGCGGDLQYTIDKLLGNEVI